MNHFKRAAGLCLLCLPINITQAAAKPLPWQELALPTAGISQQHHLAKTAAGHLIVSWVEKNEQSSTVKFSIRDGQQWQPVQTVVQVPGKLGAPPVVLGLTDGSLAAAWMPYIPNSPDKYAADIYLARSQDAGQTWSQPLKPYNEQARIYDAQMSLAALSAGKFALVWTDMRAALHEPKRDKQANRYQLLATVIDQIGQASQEITLDDDVCSCCSVDTNAVGDQIATVYRDHRMNEIRDTSLVRWTPEKVTAPVLVHEDHWHIEGCPSNGPAVSLTKKQTAVAWFSAADGVGRVKLAFSKDGGQHFANPIQVDANASGYVDALLLKDGKALVSWRARVGAEDALRVALVSPKGKITRQTTLYQGTFPKWPSRHLSLLQLDDEAFVAWTDPVQKKVRLAVIQVD